MQIGTEGPGNKGIRSCFSGNPSLQSGNSGPQLKLDYGIMKHYKDIWEIFSSAYNKLAFLVHHSFITKYNRMIA